MLNIELYLGLLVFLQILKCIGHSSFNSKFEALTSFFNRLMSLTFFPIILRGSTGNVNHFKNIFVNMKNLHPFTATEISEVNLLLFTFTSSTADGNTQSDAVHFYLISDVFVRFLSLNNFLLCTCFMNMRI